MRDLITNTEWVSTTMLWASCLSLVPVWAFIGAVSCLPSFHFPLAGWLLYPSCVFTLRNKITHRRHTHVFNHRLYRISIFNQLIKSVGTFTWVLFQRTLLLHQSTTFQTSMLKPKSFFREDTKLTIYKQISIYKCKMICTVLIMDYVLIAVLLF